jgi:hypothetical protein
MCKPNKKPAWSREQAEQAQRYIPKEIILHSHRYADPKSNINIVWRILCEFEIMRYKNINEFSFYAQSLK